jgi:hypothetical protein
MMDTRELVQFNPFLPEVIDDPYPLYRRLPNLALAGERVEWRQTATLRGLGALPVHF